MPASYELRLHLIKGQTPFEAGFVYLTGSTDASYAEALDLGTVFLGSDAYVNYIACLPSDVQMQGITVRSIIADGGSGTATPTVVLPASDFGGRIPTGSTGQTSNQDGPLITWFPELEPGERARVCKSYIPTVNESDAEDDLIGAGLLTAMDDLRAKLATALTLTTSTATWVARIWKLIEVSPGVFARVPFIRAITKSVSELFVACQRRRRPKVF